MFLVLDNCVKIVLKEFMTIITKISNLFSRQQHTISSAANLQVSIPELKLPHPLNILVIADTHNCLSQQDFRDYYEVNCEDTDICVFLGDHTDYDVEKVLYILNDTVPVVGLLGNHDYQTVRYGKTVNYLENYHVQNLNGKTFEVNGVVLTGIEGSYQYKNSDFPSFTQEESRVFCQNLPKADILLSHDRYFVETRNISHQGLIGISEYITHNNPAYHIHGHLHEPYQKRLPNGTNEISAYMYQKYHLT